MRARWRRDDGFTLPEVVLVVAILAIITVPLGNVIIGYLRNTGSTAARLNESHDAQTAGAYFAQDVASIGRRTSNDVLTQSVWAGATSGAPYACGSGTPVVLLAWDDYTAPGSSTVVEVAYTTRTIGTESQLVRWSCRGPSATAVASVLAHDVDPATAPTVTCDGTACSASVTGTVRLTLSLRDPKNTGSAFALALTGQRRQT